MTTSTSPGIGTRVISKDEKSIRTAWPTRPPMLTIGSMSPTSTPTAASARWQSVAMSVAEPSTPSARAKATPKAALDEAHADRHRARDTSGPPRAARPGPPPPPPTSPTRARSGPRRGLEGEVDGGDRRGRARVGDDLDGVVIALNEGDLGGQVDGHGEGQPAVVVGMATDQVHSSGCTGHDRTPRWALAGRVWFSHGRTEHSTTVARVAPPDARRFDRGTPKRQHPAHAKSPERPPRRVARAPRSEPADERAAGRGEGSRVGRDRPVALHLHDAGRRRRRR